MRTPRTTRRAVALVLACAGVAAAAVPAAATPAADFTSHVAAAAPGPVATGRLASVMPRWRDLPTFGPRVNDDLPTVGRVVDVPELCVLRDVAGRASNSWAQWHAHYGSGRATGVATVFVVRLWQYGVARADGAWSVIVRGVAGCAGSATRSVDGDTFRVTASNGRNRGTLWVTSDVRQIAGGEQVRSRSYSLWRRVGPAVIQVEAVRENAAVTREVMTAAQRLLALTATRYQGVLS